MEKMPLYPTDIVENDKNDEYMELSDLPFLADIVEPQLKEIPYRCRNMGNKGIDTLMRRFYRLGELYALTYMHRLYRNHGKEIFNDLQAHLKGDCTAYDMWAGGDLITIVNAFEDKNKVFPSSLLIWMKSGFYDSLNRFLIMSVLPLNDIFVPALKLENIKPEDINRMIIAVLNDDGVADFPFPSYEGWDF